MGFACAFGDVDQDGDQDLAIALTYRGQPCRDTLVLVVGCTVGVVAVYKNSGTAIERISWTSTETDVAHAGGVLFADTNLDGNLDVVGSMRGVRIFRSSTSSLFSATADLKLPPAPAKFYSMGIDANAWDSNSIAIAVALNNDSNVLNTPANSANTKYFKSAALIFRVASLRPQQRATVIIFRLLDLDDDHDLDAAAVRWGNDCNNTYTQTDRSADIYKDVYEPSGTRKSVRRPWRNAPTPDFRARLSRLGTSRLT